MKHGCVDNKTLRKFKYSQYAYCDCPNRNKHEKPINMTCPTCAVILENGIVSIRLLDRKCINCTRNSPNNRSSFFCMICIAEFQCCQFCNKNIKSGNEYLKEILNFYDCRLEKNNYRELFAEIEIKYKNKSPEEMIMLLENECKEKSKQSKQ